MSWSAIYGDAVRPPLKWTPSEKRQDTGIIGDIRCDLTKWHTQNCPPFEDVTLEVEVLDEGQV